MNVKCKHESINHRLRSKGQFTVIIFARSRSRDRSKKDKKKKSGKDKPKAGKEPASSPVRKESKPKDDKPVAKVTSTE